MTRRVITGLALLLTVGGGTLAALAEAPPSAEQLAFFEKKIRPVLAAKCYACHSSKTKEPKGALLLDTREGLRRGGATGPAVTAADPQKSLLIKALKHLGPKMPPGGKLPDAVIADFEAWVRMGAPDPRGEPGPVVQQGIDLAKGRRSGPSSRRGRRCRRR